MCPCIPPGPSTTAARPFACRHRTPTICASNIGSPARMRILTWSLAWVLAGMLHGLERELEPPAVLTGNAYLQDGDPLPTNWPAAIERFATSEFARATLGEKFTQSLHHGEARRDAGVQLAHHAARNRALPGTVVASPKQAMTDADAQNFYFATHPAAAAACAAARRDARGCVHRRRWNLRAVGGAAPGRARLHRGAARSEAPGVRRLGAQRRADAFSATPAARKNSRNSWAPPTRVSCGISRSKA